jgi:hypothetical protein
VLEILRRERQFMFAALVVSLGFAATLPILNVDSFIVKQNIRREINAQSADRVDLDAQYFLDLSDDAVPALVAAYRTPSVPDSVHEKLGAALACVNYERGQDQKKLTWQSFQFARFNADQALALIQKDIKGYKVTDTDYPATVTTPSGGEFSCSSYYYD